MFDQEMRRQKKEKKKAEKEQRKLDKEQDERCFPVVLEYFRLLNEHALTLGETTFEEKYEYVRPIAGEFLEICLKNNVKVSDFEHIQQLITKVCADVNETVVDSVNRSISICLKDYWGIDNRDKDLQVIDEKLKIITKREAIKDEIVSKA